MVGSIWLEGIVSQKSMADEKEAMEDASTIATEAVVSVRTVQALGTYELFYSFFIQVIIFYFSFIVKILASSVDVQLC